jgi:acetyl-CoA carboxylase biotin carboxyl carrier protein
MNFKEIQELIRLVDKTGLATFSMRDGEFEIEIKSQKYIESKAQGRTQIVHAAAPVSAPVYQQAAPASVPAPSQEINRPKAEEPQTADATPVAGLIEIKSPMVGTFYRSSSPDKPPYIQVGDTVNVGDTICVIEAMKLFNEIESEFKGKIVKVLVEDSKPVEYDQPLFLVDPR